MLAGLGIYSPVVTGKLLIYQPNTKSLPFGTIKLSVSRAPQGALGIRRKACFSYKRLPATPCPPVPGRPSQICTDLGVRLGLLAIAVLGAGQLLACVPSYAREQAFSTNEGECCAATLPRSIISPYSALCLATSQRDPIFALSLRQILKHNMHSQGTCTAPGAQHGQPRKGGPATAWRSPQCDC